MRQILESDDLTVTILTRETGTVSEEELQLIGSHFDGLLAGMYRHLATGEEDT